MTWRHVCTWQQITVHNISSVIWPKPNDLLRPRSTPPPLAGTVASVLALCPRRAAAAPLPLHQTAACWPSQLPARSYSAKTPRRRRPFLSGKGGKGQKKGRASPNSGGKWKPPFRPPQNPHISPHPRADHFPRRQWRRRAPRRRRRGRSPLLPPHSRADHSSRIPRRQLRREARRRRRKGRNPQIPLHPRAGHSSSVPGQQWRMRARRPLRRGRNPLPVG